MSPIADDVDVEYRKKPRSVLSLRRNCRKPFGASAFRYDRHKDLKNIFSSTTVHYAFACRTYRDGFPCSPSNPSGLGVACLSQTACAIGGRRFTTPSIVV